MAEPTKDPSLWILLSCTTVSAMGGLAAMVKRGKRVSMFVIFSTTFYNAMAGLIIGLLWYNYFLNANNVYFLIGVSGAAGIGGVTILDVFLQMLTGGGLKIVVKPVEENKPTDNKPETD